MPTFLEYLESFNRKERFFLVGWALDRPTFQLGPNFRAGVAERLGSIPEDALVFMDYHLDWLHASAFLAGREVDPSGVYDNSPKRIITGNQEDIDLVIAFAKPAGVKLLLIEAKAETGWTNKQLQSKADRLRAIFGDLGDNVPAVEPVFVLASPVASDNIKTENWPSWMLRDGAPLWIPLKVPTGRRQVTGWDKPGDRPHKNRTWFKLLEKADASDD